MEHAAAHQLNPNNGVFLMAEDNPADAELFSAMLNQAFKGEYSVVCVDRFTKIAPALQRNRFRALILDMDLPDQSGVDNIHQLSKQHPDLPIIVLTGNSNLDQAITSLKKGAQDYLSKNSVTPDILARSVHYAQERKKIEQRLKVALEEAASKNTQLEAQAKHDPLTGLANRAYFHEEARRVLLRAKRKQQWAALLYFDLNEFKKINDTYGHSAGDDLLKQVASRLTQVVRDSDFLARVGGDEFVLITDLLETKKDIGPLIQRIQNQFDIAFKLGSHKIIVSSSIGVAFYPEAETLELLIKHADCAMYEAKNNPNLNTCFYSKAIAAQYSRAKKIESLLPYAIEKKEFYTLFQPVINVENRSEIHLEALARWHSNSLGEIHPEEFIPIAENTPAINGITQAVIRDSHRLYTDLQQQGLSLSRLSINITAAQLSSEYFCKAFLQWLLEHDLPPNLLCLELTERQVVHNFKQCQQQFILLQSKGIQIALDDFGSGFSSVTYLLDFPFNILKLDRFLVSHLDQNPRNQALVAGIVEMAHRLNIQVVAEGIEEEAERQKAIEIGCDYLQGHFFSNPLALDSTLGFYR